jgi:hypothetical protein
MKFQNPSTNLQINSNHQYSETFGDWDLDIIWDLEFGIWSLKGDASRHHPFSGK